MVDAAAEVVVVDVIVGGGSFVRKLEKKGMVSVLRLFHSFGNLYWIIGASSLRMGLVLPRTTKKCLSLPG